MASSASEHAHCDWLPELSGWSHFASSGLHVVSRKKKIPRKPYNKSFIDQACSVKTAGYCPRSFFCEFMDFDFVSVHKHVEKELGQLSAALTSHTWSITHTSYDPYGAARNAPIKL